MRYAVRHRLIDYNPLVDAERPRRQDHSDEKQIIVLNPEQVKVFLGAVDDPLYSVFFQLAILSGARQGELFGLKWSDIDYEQNTALLKTTKNGSPRSLIITPEVRTELNNTLRKKIF